MWCDWRDLVGTGKGGWVAARESLGGVGVWSGLAKEAPMVRSSSLLVRARRQ